MCPSTFWRLRWSLAVPSLYAAVRILSGVVFIYLEYTFLIYKKNALYSHKGRLIRGTTFIIQKKLLYISSYSLTGTTPGPPTVTSAILLQSYLLHLCSQVPRSQWASLSVRTTYAYSSSSTHLTGLSTMKLQNIIATEVLFVKVFREFSENLKRPHQKGLSKTE